MGKNEELFDTQLTAADIDMYAADSSSTSALFRDWNQSIAAATINSAGGTLLDAVAVKNALSEAAYIPNGAILCISCARRLPGLSWAMPNALSERTA